MMPSPESSEERMAQEFKPGDKVPSSGVYRVLHKDHREEHDATLREGELFPNCSVCDEGVRFRLVQSAKLIDRDVDFVGE
jgi:YjzC-like protein